MISARSYSERENVVYEIENGKNYLVAKVPDTESYIYRMLVRNDIKGLVRAQLRSRDNEEYLYYPVNEMMVMKEMTDISLFTSERVRYFIQSLIEITDSMDDYLLPFEGLIIDPSMIFEVLDGGFKWIYRPLSEYEADRKGEEAGENFGKLFEFMLDRIDKSDDSAVKMMYTLYQASRDAVSSDDGREVTEIILKEARKLLGITDNYRDLNIREFNEEEKRYIPENSINEVSTTVTKKNHKKIESKKKEKSSGTSVAKKVWGFLTTDVSSFKKQNKKDEESEDDEACEEAYYPEEENVSIIQYDERSIARNEKEVSQFYPEGDTPFMRDQEGKRGVYSLQPVDAADTPLLISQFPFFIGKERDHVNATIDDSTVSRYHARIDRSESGSFSFTDLNSTNGSFLNGIRLLPYERMSLREGDTVVISRKRYKFAMV